jgi:hypothetical protein
MVLQGPLGTLTDMPTVRQKGPMRWLVAGASGVVAAVFLAAVAQTSTTAAVTPASTTSVATVTSTSSSASSSSTSQLRLRTRAS